MSKLQSFLETALQEKNRKDSAHLGNRSLYIGASDIAGCPRKAVLARRQPVRFDTCTLLKFARGHAAEDLVAQIFQAGGLTPQREMELIHPDYPFLECHVDFHFRFRREDGRGRIHVLELKSTNGIPCEPYGSWVNQLHVQMGFVRLHNPGWEITGSILAVDLNSGAWQEFNGYAPQDLVFEVLLNKGIHIWECLQDETLAPVVETGLLCDHCPYRMGCPAFAGEVAIPREILALAESYLRLYARKAQADRDLKKLKEDILSFTGSAFRGSAEDVLLAAYDVAPGEMIDAGLLKERYPEIYEEVKKERAGFTRLDIKRVKTQAQTSAARQAA
ncbi:hypothetical protein [Geoalkalibacter halelectricus]|uniref:hypothetical protein n=1 Tax=Geoalkalibacter halelectricus TaxID=2847045 RepID=UPI00266F9B1F|nr:hypothetical protein [Geoalkalibacter halelectricus]MDO3380503.1 hypothetical protein [Geoalkalibacter halelectricus]